MFGTDFAVRNVVLVCNRSKLMVGKSGFKFQTGEVFQHTTGNLRTKFKSFHFTMAHMLLMIKDRFMHSLIFINTTSQIEEEKKVLTFKSLNENLIGLGVFFYRPNVNTNIHPPHP